MAGLGSSAPARPAASARLAWPGEKAAEMKRWGELLSPKASYQLAEKKKKKASPRQSCLTIKGERLREQLSSLAGECGNEVRAGGGGGKAGSGGGRGLLGQRWEPRAGTVCVRERAPPGTGGGGEYFSACRHEEEPFVGVFPPPHRGPSGRAHPGPGPPPFPPQRGLLLPPSPTQSCPRPPIPLPGGEGDFGKEMVSQGECWPLPRTKQLPQHLTGAPPALQKLKQTSDDSAA